MTEDLMEVGPWACEKLDCLSKYLSAYTTIMRKYDFKGYIYVDAFAGTGDVVIKGTKNATPEEQQNFIYDPNEVDDYKEYTSGSGRRALEIPHPFTHYIFIEKKPERVERLKALKEEFSGIESKIVIREKDCNEYLLKTFIPLLKDNRGFKAIIFLDPFGMQVPWSTIESIAETRCCEVLINFPVGMAIQRLLKNSGIFTDKERAKLNAYFGTSDWYDLLYKTDESDMFGGTVKKIKNASDTIVNWYRFRLSKIFGHTSRSRLIKTTKGNPLYYLIHAGPNKTGVKIASDVLKQGTIVKAK